MRNLGMSWKEIRELTDKIPAEPSHKWSFTLTNEEVIKIIHELYKARCTLAMELAQYGRQNSRHPSGLLLQTQIKLIDSVTNGAFTPKDEKGEEK